MIDKTKDAAGVQKRAFHLLLSLVLAAGLCLPAIPAYAEPVEGEPAADAQVDAPQQADVSGNPDAVPAAGGEEEPEPVGDVSTPEETATPEAQSEAPELSTQADDDMASGTSGTCTWAIDANGKLTVRPTSGSTGTLGKANPWLDYKSSIISASFEGTVVHPNGSCNMFDGCSNLTSVNLSGLDTSQATILYAMFRDCSSLVALDLSNLDTSSVRSMSNMFNGCSSLTALDVSGLDASSAWEMNGMFSGCSSLVDLNVTGLVTSSVSEMYGMFSGCSSLTTLDVSSFDTSNVADMDGAFSGCSSLATLNLSNFNVSDVGSMEEMFSGCSSLQTLDLSSFDTSSVTSMSGMFSNCESLSKLILGRGFKMQGSAGLPEPPDDDTYSGKWACANRPFGTATAAELMATGDEGCAGTWMWEKKIRVSMEDKTVTYTGKPVYMSCTTVAFPNDHDYYLDQWGESVYADSDKTQWLGEDFEPIDAGTYYVVKWVTVNCTYESPLEECWTTSGGATAVLTIEPASLSAATVSAPDCDYDGSAQEPDVTVTLDGKTLERGKDYTVAYSGNGAPGTAKVTVTGTGNYKGTAEGAFEISSRAGTVRLSPKSATYTGKPVAIGEASVTGSTGEVAYRYYADAKCTKEVAASKVVDAGTYWVRATVAADDDYAEATSPAVKLTIAKAASSVSLPGRDATYTGKAIAMGGASVTGSSGKVAYTYYKDAKCKKKVAAKKVKGVGTYYVKATVAADANHAAATSKAAKLVVNPRPVKLKSVKGYTVDDKAHAGNKGLKLKWAKPKAECAGVEFRVQAYDKKSGKWKTVQSEKAAKKDYPTKCTTGKKSLKAKTKYQVQVRTYAKVSGKYYYSDWSAAKAAKTPK